MQARFNIILKQVKKQIGFFKYLRYRKKITDYINSAIHIGHDTDEEIIYLIVSLIKEGTKFKFVRDILSTKRFFD